MKKSFLITLLLLLITTFNSYSQKQCVNFSKDYIVNPDDTTTEIGKVFYESSGINFYKPTLKGQYYHTYNTYHKDSLGGIFMIGDIAFSVKNYTCNNKVLTFNSLASTFIIVDGDTIMNKYDYKNNTIYFSNKNYTLTRDTAYNFTVKGNFNDIQLLGGCHILKDICIDCNFDEKTCLNLPEKGDTLLNTNNIKTGDVLFQTGNIKLIKPSDISLNGHGNSYQYIHEGKFLMIGDISIDVSSESCTNKTLTFDYAYIEAMAIDGDTIFKNDSGGQPMVKHFQGKSYEFITNGNNYQITGEFNTVTLFSNSTYISNICLSCSPIYKALSITELENELINIYPNPVNQSFTFTNKEQVINQQYIIHDITGNVIKTEWIKDITNTVNSSDFNPGIYFISIAGVTKKFIKE